MLNNNAQREQHQLQAISFQKSFGGNGEPRQLHKFGFLKPCAHRLLLAVMATK